MCKIMFEFDQSKKSYLVSTQPDPNVKYKPEYAYTSVVIFRSRNINF